MSRLADIPIKVEGTFSNRQAVPPVVDSGLGDGVGAVLSELATMLERAGMDTQALCIDLRSLPMNDGDRSRLRSILGDGEVSASVKALGLSAIRETGVAGVWWVEHFDADGTSIAESLEVVTVPQILACAPDEMRAAAHELRRRTADAAGRPTVSLPGSFG
jgi:hypothetical protein